MLVRVFHLKQLGFHKHLDKANVIVITVHSFLRIVCTVGSLSSIVLLYLSATYNNISAISWRPVLVEEEAGVP
jgi:hypothetical protein